MRGMRNIRRKTSYDKAREILMQADYGILSTTCGDGLPYGIPLCFALSGNRFISTALPRDRSWTTWCTTAVYA